MTCKSNPSIIRRFRGALGKQRLIETLLCQPLLSANVKAAESISKCVKLSELPSDHQIIAQGGQDNELYFILSGTLRILVNSREIAIRRANEHVGEMALIDRTALRSATVITKEPSVVAKISESDFSKIADRYPLLWRKLAGTVAQRLRERNRFHTTPHSIPMIFIGNLHPIKWT